jgi:peptidoglycan/LPS O-acetylase OafA/YrhL
MFGGYTWAGYGPSHGLGPFHFQESTLLMYFGYFLLGTIFGNISLEKGLFSDTFSFMKKWQVWTGLCLFMYVLLLLIDNPSVGNPLNQFVQANNLSGTTAHAIYCTFYVATCTLGCLAYLTIFRGLVNYSNRIWSSLASNSFFIYLIHYIFILWGQYVLLQTTIPAILKFAIVFLFAISLSWLLGHIIRKNTIISKYI